MARSVNSLKIVSGARNVSPHAASEATPRCIPDVASPFVLCHQDDARAVQSLLQAMEMAQPGAVIPLADSGLLSRITLMR